MTAEDLPMDERRHERRWLNAAEAARYLSMRPAGFMRRVRMGQIPPGSTALGSRSSRWYTDELDSFMRGEDPRRDTVSDRISKKLAEMASRPRGRGGRRKEPT
jgi:predicted DNA-binding transcriptional regulator AlpA